MRDANIAGFIVILCGLFSAAGGLFGWEWFLNNRKARLWVNLLGRNGARGFYVVLGVALAGFGSALVVGLL